MKTVPQLSLENRIDLDYYRAQAGNPENITKHFCLLYAVMKNYDVNERSRLFYLDESDFPRKGVSLGELKCPVNKGTRSDAKESRFCGTFVYVTMMHVISGSDKVRTERFSSWNRRKIQMAGQCEVGASTECITSITSGLYASCWCRRY